MLFIDEVRYHRSMPMIHPSSPRSLVEFEPAVALFRSLGDPTRLAILVRLSASEARVVDLTSALDLAQSTVSAHLACLRECGLVEWRPEGRQSYYRLAEVGLDGLLAAAEEVLEATGSAVALCNDYGMDRRDEK